MLRGRVTEQAVIDGLLERARAGEGGGLVLQGEPGIGKSALLAYAAERSAPMRVLRAAGVEAEGALPYAMLHQLLLPVLDQMGRLPGPQSRALATALGIEEAEPPPRFLVSVAALTLLSEAAGERPLLCLVDDLQWADTPSAEALMFVARRLVQEPIGLLAAVPVEGDRSVDTAGVPALSLAGLDPDAAADILNARFGQQLHAAVRDELVRASGGNPLALRELPHALSSEHLAGREPLPEFLPLTAQLECAFLRRIRQGPPGGEGLLLLAAAAGSANFAVLRRAAGRLGADAALLESAGLSDLVRIDSSGIGFRHPLVRAAVYRAASQAARQQAHLALAAALGGAEDTADRRAWHLAEAAEGPDEEVASALESSADRALRRSGHAAAASVLERAAQLSVGDAERARRLVAAAAASWSGGDGARATALLDLAERIGTRDAGVRLDLGYLRGLIELRAGVPADGLSTLLPAAREAAATDPGRAVRIVHATGEAAFLSADDGALAEVHRLSLDLPAEDGSQALLSRFIALAGRAGMGAETPGSDPTLMNAQQLDDPELLARAGGMALGIGLHDLSRRLRARAVARARTLGAAGILAWALEGVVTDEILLGRYASAEAHAEEGRRLALETGQPNCACAHVVSLALVAALRGREEDTCRLAEEALREAAGRRLVRAAGGARAALGIMALAAGRPAEALDQFEALWRSWPTTSRRGQVLLVVPDLVEAAVRAGQPERCRDLISALLAWAERRGSPEVLAVATRARALLDAGEEAERGYLEALRLHAAAERPLDHGRTALLYGEFLRRRRRRRDARQPLRMALDTFERLGASVWAERARSELRATGETVHRPMPSALDHLTGQEMQIVRAVGAGLTNREVAAKFFISPRTVDHHLRRVFNKLGISSRAELIHLAATDRLRDSPAGEPDEC